MRNPNFPAHLQAWAAEHGLRPSARIPCGHALLGRGLRSDAHEQLCIRQRRLLLGEASVWGYNKTRVLVAFTYGPGPLEIEHAGYWGHVTAYAERLGIAAYAPPGKSRLHRLYDTESTVVLYSRRGIDLRPLTEHIARTWVPRPAPTYPQRTPSGGGGR